MTGASLQILFIAISLAAWAAVIIFSYWLFRLSIERQNKIISRWTKSCLKKDLLQSSDPVKDKRTLQILFIANISSALLGIIVLAVFAVVGLDGPNGEIPRNVILYLVIPVWLEACYFSSVLFGLGTRILNKLERQKSIT